MEHECQSAKDSNQNSKRHLRVHLKNLCSAQDHPDHKDLAEHLENRVCKDLVDPEDNQAQLAHPGREERPDPREAWVYQDLQDPEESEDPPVPLVQLESVVDQVCLDPVDLEVNLDPLEHLVPRENRVCLDRQDLLDHEENLDLLEPLVCRCFPSSMKRGVGHV